MPTEMLTARQEQFCRALVSGAGSAAEAARQAGYAANTARAQASRLLDQPNVLVRLDELRQDEQKARAGVCARLWQRIDRLAERAEAEGKLGLAMRGVYIQIRLVRELGLPDLPADASEHAIEAAGGDPAELCGDLDLGEAEAAEAMAAAALDGDALDGDAADGEAADVDGWERMATHADPDPAAAGAEADRAGSRAADGEPVATGTGIINGAAAKALRALTDGDERQRIALGRAAPCTAGADGLNWRSCSAHVSARPSGFSPPPASPPS